MIRFNILTNEWKINIVDHTDSILIINNIQNWGVCCYQQRCIYLSNKLKADAKRVLIHELVHAIIYETQIKINITYNEEDICEFISKYYNTISGILDQVLVLIYDELHINEK